MLLGDQYRKYVEKLKWERQELVKLHNLETARLRKHFAQVTKREASLEQSIDWRHESLRKVDLFQAEMDSKLPPSDRLYIVGKYACHEKGCIFRTSDREVLRDHSRDGRHYTFLPHYLNPAPNNSCHDPSPKHKSVKEANASSDRTPTSILLCTENQMGLQDLEAANVFLTVPQPGKHRSSISNENTTTSPISGAQSRSLHMGSTKKRRVLKELAKFKCSECPKRFTRASTLRDHARTHTGERPFVCSACGKAFVLLKDKNRHEYLHSGQLRFVCKFGFDSDRGCGREFVREDGLAAHFRTEAGWACITNGLLWDPVDTASSSSDSGISCKSAIRKMAEWLGIIHDTQSWGCDEEFLVDAEGEIKHLGTDSGTECWRPLLVRIALKDAKTHRDERIRMEEREAETGDDGHESPSTDHGNTTAIMSTDDNPIESAEIMRLVDEVRVIIFSRSPGKEGDQFWISFTLAKRGDFSYQVVFGCAVLERPIFGPDWMDASGKCNVSRLSARVRVPPFADTRCQTKYVPVFLRVTVWSNEGFVPLVKDIPVGTFKYTDTSSEPIEG